jgi:hypothetical protein
MKQPVVVVPKRVKKPKYRQHQYRCGSKNCIQADCVGLGHAKTSAGNDQHMPNCEKLNAAENCQCHSSGKKGTPLGNPAEQTCTD